MKNRRNIEYYNKVLVFVDENIGKGFRIKREDVSSSLLKSKTTLYNACKEIVGLSCREVIDKKYVEKINFYYRIELLDETEIAEKLGFCDRSALCHFYYEQTGTTIGSDRN